MNKSFTLIEILVVIVVIGILSAFVLVGMSSITNNANIAKNKAFLNSMDNSLLLARVSQWKFDELTTAIHGSSISDSWGISTGTLYTADGSLEKIRTDCPSGNCLYFDGVDDYISHTAISFADLVPHTYSAWVKWGTVNPTDFVIPFGNGSSSSNIYFTGASGYKKFRYRANGQSATLAADSDTTLIFNGGWHLVI